MIWSCLENLACGLQQPVVLRHHRMPEEQSLAGFWTCSQRVDVLTSSSQKLLTLINCDVALWVPRQHALDMRGITFDVLLPRDVRSASAVLLS